MVKCQYCAYPEVCACGKCHMCNNVNFAYGMGKKCPDTKREWYKPRSQKLLGLMKMRVHLGAIGMNIVGINSIFPASDPSLHVGEPSGFPQFARPCPLKPRHGFVDSRVVHDATELKAVIDETLAAEPEGEIMLCTPIDAALNAVWTPFLLTVGAGNDGATAGKQTMNFPLSGTRPPELASLRYAAAGIGEGEMPYIEVVWEKPLHPANDMVQYLTQLRAGPTLKGGSIDSIPRAVVVGKIIHVNPNSSLLEWETLMQEESESEGLVVYHPGGSPTDHFSVHARSFNIPLMITREPIMGETLSPTGQTPIDPLAILRGVVVGDVFDLTHLRQFEGDTFRAVNLLLVALHNSSNMGGESGWWLGFAAAMMMRLGAIALRGEVRHIDAKSMKGSRDGVYQRAVGHPLQRQRAALPRNINVLRYGFNPGSVGGIKWATCGKATAHLYDAVGELARNPSPETAGILIRALNVAVNQAHNGGWWMNKFCGHQAFDDAPNGKLTQILDCVPFMWRAHQTLLHLTPTQLSKKVGLYKGWTPVDLSPARIIKAEILTMPGVNGLHIQISDRLLRSKHKPIIIPVEQLMLKLPDMLRGKLILSANPSGLALSLSLPHEPLITLWEEGDIPLT